MSWSQAKIDAVYGKKREGLTALRTPQRCPGCGHKITVVPCIECASEAEKQRARRTEIGDGASA